MKFAKVLFFICVIGICAALERTVSRAETEYMASTKAARVKVGYKDLMMANTAQDGIMDKNYNVRVQDNFDFVDCELDVVLLKSGGFNSGIPFYFKNPSVTANKKVMANFLKIGDSANNYYLPFNTISRNCEFNASMDPNVKLNFSCNLENKNGVNVFKIFFQDLDPTNMDHTFNASMVQQEIDNRQTDRRRHINTEFQRVTRAVMQASKIVRDIDNIKKSDQEVKAAKERLVADLKRQIAELQTTKTQLESKKQTQSLKVQQVQSEKTNNFNTKEKKISFRISLEKSIQTLEGGMATPALLDALKREIEENKTQLRYWLTGAVYHRVCSEAESSALFDLALDDAK